jgi:hypothetical protein
MCAAGFPDNVKSIRVSKAETLMRYPLLETSSQGRATPAFRGSQYVLTNPNVQGPPAASQEFILEI